MLAASRPKYEIRNQRTLAKPFKSNPIWWKRWIKRVSRINFLPPPPPPIKLHFALTPALTPLQRRFYFDFRKSMKYALFSFLLPSPPRAFQPPDRTSNIGPWPISFRGNNVLFRFRIIKRKFICAASFPHRKLNHREICHAGKKRVPAIKCELSFVRNGRRVINIFDGGGRRGRKKKSGAKTEKCKPSN